jgi:hypothetical protein
MITLRQMIEILEQDECLEIFPQGGETLAIYGGQELPKDVEPYLGWKCAKLASASLDSVGVSVVPLEKGAEDAQTEQE